MVFLIINFDSRDNDIYMVSRYSHSPLIMKFKGDKKYFHYNQTSIYPELIYAKEDK